MFVIPVSLLYKLKFVFTSIRTQPASLILKLISYAVPALSSCFALSQASLCSQPTGWTGSAMIPLNFRAPITKDGDRISAARRIRSIPRNQPVFCCVVILGASYGDEANILTSENVISFTCFVDLIFPTDLQSNYE